jgi:nucleoid-associated protein YgaU
MLNPASMFTTPDVLSQSTLKRATIKTIGLPTGDERNVDLEVQFNPAELTITKEVDWSAPEGKSAMPGLNAPDLEFGGGHAATFSLTLYFDTTQESSSLEQDVRKYTNKLFLLTMYDWTADGDDKDPPVVQFTWGEMELFAAVVTKVDVSFTLFYPEGKPARAKATVTFKQFDWEDDGYQNPTTRTEARKTRRVNQGERLDMIAYQEYGHVSHWRHLAEANNLLNPLDLKPGQLLIIPPIE